MNDLTITSEDIISEIADANPFYSIVVATEIAVRYSIRSPLRGATGPDKPVLAIQKLNDLKQDLSNPASAQELTGLFSTFGGRIMNDGNESIEDYEMDDSYGEQTQKIKASKVVFSGEDDFDDLSDVDTELSEDDDFQDDFDDEGTDVPEDDEDDLDPSEDDVDEIDNR